MNKITKRIVASISAAALIVSTFGSNSFSGTMMDSVYAEESATTSNRKGRSTGFDNLEQDTDGEYYNTGYGLHTNKTASVAEGIDDGRTFDVNLESWYVGENPVDIATILDASGSMAWTVNRLEPLNIRNQITDADIATLKSKYSTLDDVMNLPDTAASLTDDEVEVALTAIQNSTTDKYLPEDVVEMIMDPANTDNSKLSYSDYKYYVYEERSSVSEFVPLGYWDGGAANSLIGYYNFDKNLTNQVTGDNARYIQNAEIDGEFKSDSVAQIIPQPIFKDGYLDLSETDKNGNLVVSLSELALNTNQEIDIQFKLNCEDVNKKCAPQAPILYLGDGTNNNYIALMRGRSHNTGSGASNHIYVFEGKGNETEGSQLDTYKSDGKTRLTKTSNGETKETNDNDILKDQTGKELTCHWKIVKNSDVYDITLTVGSNTYVYHTDDKFSIDPNKLYLVIGGNELLPYGNLENSGEIVIDKDDLKGIKIKDLVLSGTSTTDTSVKISLPLTNSSGLTDSEKSISAEYNKQSTDGENISLESQDSTNAEVSYKDNALNLAQTAKNGAVLLDPAQEKLTGNEFTISFKVKRDKNDTNPSAVANLFYLGPLKIGPDYCRIYRASGGSANRLKMNTQTNSDPKEIDNNVNINSIFNSNNYTTITITIDGETVKQYTNGNIYTTDKAKNLSASIDLSNISCIIGGLWDSKYDGADILIDDLYIFDQALDDAAVKALFSSSGSGSLLKKGSCGQYHATTATGEDIAQIKDSLAQNLLDSERRGWYYVNSHSTWEDIATKDDLESGKNYIGIYTDEGLDYCTDDGKLNATIPSSADWTNDKDYAHRIVEGNGNSSDYPKYKAPTIERSIRFFVDSVGYLRCYVWSGDETKAKDNPRTFCSVVYYNWDNSKGNRSSVTKYEQLNEAMNAFFRELAENSDLTNSAVVRFSTNNVIGDNEDATTDNLTKLVMKDWTNWSDYYQEAIKDGVPSKENYLQDLLIPEDGETSLGMEGSANKSGEYPYVITGGTYTWTGLKSFYDNMIDGNSGDTDLTNYNISIDARDKYLIIFTDGRDNTQDCEWDENGNPKKETGSNYKKQTYVGDYKPEKSGITYDGELAEAWANKIKESGYTIFCVMMATGSISQTANKAEFNKAYNFLNTLAGSETENKKALDEAIDDFLEAYNNWKETENSDLPELNKDTWYDAKLDSKACGDNAYKLYLEAKNLQDYMNTHVLIAEPGETNTTEKAFSDILAQIQQPRDDYTVQDYIDPRFNLIDKNGVLYKLGPDGNITYGEERKKVGNIIDNPDAVGLPFTTIKAENVNVESVTTDIDGKKTYNNPDENGTGYIYYDDVKDMYYLRWTDQIIPMRDSSFDTDGTTDYLDVWSATIRLKAKDDFIGGNDILTNGNEAGENLVFSTSTIDNMDDNYEVYGFTSADLVGDKVPERKKLQRLSGTDRKINAVDAGGVSQAVYGKGVDIPSSGFPRVTVNVRLLKLDAKNLNDVIYMGEVVSPTMMLADLENDYMTGSYYLQYLERYAYRLYGNDADQQPLIELLNQWLKINDEKEAEKTFTIPYIYLPDPEYDDAGNLVMNDGKVSIENSTGLDSGVAGTDDAFSDLNLCDVTGFITYTWKRDDGSREEQQEIPETTPTKYDITKDYVVKNTDQIKYNLQLKFTPLKKEDLTEFTLDKNFIKNNSSGKGEKFFNVDETFEFNDDGVTEWTFTNRAKYLKAMVSETHTYEPHVMYASDKDGGKWVLIDPDSAYTLEKAIEVYIKDEQIDKSALDEKQIEDKGVYDWYSSQVVGNEQIEAGKLTEYYTDTPENVNISSDGFSLEANTTYIKDVVNGALALELVVDGKYLKGTNQQIKAGKTYTFIATRYYDDPYDPLPYGGSSNYVNADTGTEAIDPSGGNKGAGEGLEYRLTFVVDKDGCPQSIPEAPQDGEFYTVYAYLNSVEVKDSEAADGYAMIDKKGYAKADALPIGTYKIEVDEAGMRSTDSGNQYYIGDNDDVPQYFQYLKIDNTPTSFTYDRFPESVYSVSETAKVSTDDGEYLIWDDPTDNASKNIADNNREKDVASGSQTLTFYFGTVPKRTINGNELSDTVGYSRNDEAEGKDYAKDRLGIMILSADQNSLFISKEVTHTNSKTESYKEKFWTFTVTFTPNADDESKSEFEYNNKTGFGLTWYQRDKSSDPWKKKESSDLTTGYPDSDGGTTEKYPETIPFDGPDKDGKYTATIKLKHNEKVLINNLPSGTWQVTELDERNTGDQILYSAHNDMDKVDEYSWSNKTDEWASLPGTGVEFTNQFPHYVFSAGGLGTYLFILCGGLLLLMASVLYYLSRLRKSKSRDKPDG